MTKLFEYYAGGIVDIFCPQKQIFVKIDQKRIWTSLGPLNGPKRHKSQYFTSVWLPRGRPGPDMTGYHKVKRLPLKKQNNLAFRQNLPVTPTEGAIYHSMATREIGIWPTLQALAPSNVDIFVSQVIRR